MLSSSKTITLMLAFTFLIFVMALEMQPFVIAESATHGFLINIEINSPLNNTIYYTNSVPLRVTIYEVLDRGDYTIRRANYTLDKQGSVPITLSYEGMSDVSGEHLPYSTTSGTAELPKLSHGRHKITVSGEFTSEYYSNSNEAVVYFDVNTPEPSPTPTVPEFPPSPILLLLLITLFTVAMLKKNERISCIKNAGD